MVATIVTCFVANTNNRPDRKTDEYLVLGEQLLTIKTPKIVFMDPTLLDRIKYDVSTTLVVPFPENGFYLQQYRASITKFSLRTTFSAKDTLDYMLLICEKTEMVKKATELNPFQTEQFVWIDFGINHIYQSFESKARFESDIMKLVQQEYGRVRMASIINPVVTTLNLDLYRDVAWYFAGGVFGGSAPSLNVFAQLTRDKCLEVIDTEETLMWEVNIWYLVFRENNELFDLYPCDHNDTLIQNY
jgi:hypothetical protein